MKSYEYLTMEQIDILLKCYYLRKYSMVAEVEDMTVGKVKHIKETALRTIRLSYSKSYIQGLRFDGEVVLRHMAERCGMNVGELSNSFAKYIAEGLVSNSGKCWERIRKKGNMPTAAELLDFLYNKFEVDIEGYI